MLNRMEKQSKKIAIIIFIVAYLVLPQLVLAANSATNRLNNVASINNGPYSMITNATGVAGIVSAVIVIALDLLGVIFLILMIYAGYNWMTAQGEEEKVNKAKETIARAIIGIIIVVGSYAIWQFIYSKLI